MCALEKPMEILWKMRTLAEGKSNMRRLCEHRDAYETNHSNDDDKEYTHWYCPTCDSYFPLIGDTDHWIKELDSETVSDQA